MTIEVTSTLERIEIQMPTNADDRALLVVWTSTNVDDPDDDRLPIKTTGQKTLSWKTPVMAEDGTFTGEMEATDISGEDQRVQDIAAVLWTE